MIRGRQATSWWRAALTAGLAMLTAACASAPSPPAALSPAAVSAPDGSPVLLGPPMATAAPGPAPVGPAIRVVAVGDIMLGGSAAPILAERGYDYPFARLSPLLAAAEVVFGNLEGPLTARGTPVADKQYVFRSPPGQVAPALKRAGFNVLSLANNHILDYGVEGLVDTMAALDAAGIRYAGAGLDATAARRPAILETPAGRVAVLAYSLTFPESFWAGPQRPGTAFGHAACVAEDVRAARAQAELVLVSFHWGREGTTDLRDYQIELAHAAIDAGAHAVLGHHPHVLQAVERYRHGVILYSLGNFVFGSYSPTARRSVIAALEFRAGRLAGLRLIPIDVLNAEVLFQPRPLAGAEAEAVIAHLKTLSAARGTVLEVAADGTGLLELERSALAR